MIALFYKVSNDLSELIISIWIIYSPSPCISAEVLVKNKKSLDAQGQTGGNQGSWSERSQLRGWGEAVFRRRGRKARLRRLECWGQRPFSGRLSPSGPGTGEMLCGVPRMGVVNACRWGVRPPGSLRPLIPESQQQRRRLQRVLSGLSLERLESARQNSKCYLLIALTHTHHLNCEIQKLKSRAHKHTTSSHHLGLRPE